MSWLIAGLGLFLCLHLVPVITVARSRAIDVLGVNVYRGVFSVLALIALGLIVFGYSRAPMIELWQPPTWGRHVTAVVMLPAFILLAGAYLPSNLKRRVPHPMLIAIIIWSLGHLLANGDLASVLLFATLGLFAVADLISVLLRSPRAPRQPVSWIYDLLTIVVGSAAYALVARFHMVLFGMPVVA